MWDYIELAKEWVNDLFLYMIRPPFVNQTMSPHLATAGAYFKLCTTTINTGATTHLTFVALRQADDSRGSAVK